MQTDDLAKQALIERLLAEHNDLHARVSRLEQHRALSPDEQREVTHLKKLKLRAKERLFVLRGA